MNYSELKKLCDSRRVQVSDICCRIDMTYQGLKSGLNSGKIGSDKVLALCKALQVSPNAFYGWEMIQPITACDAQACTDSFNNRVVQEGMDVLREQLAIKDKQIAELHELLKK